MPDFADTWKLTRGRFVAAVKDLNGSQLNWRLHDQALTLGETALHVAGVEVSFMKQLLGLELDEFGDRLAKAATDGVVNDQPFPFGAEEITPEVVAAALAMAEGLVAPHIENPDPLREVTIKSALGPMIDGTGAFARLAYHPGYHQGQAHLISTAPGFPA